MTVKITDSQYGRLS